jgi:EmrB/QacA subfamily drug resistance transporter
MSRKWWTLLVVCVATFMLLLDITVVNTALPAIQEDLDASFTDLQWVIDAYALTLAAFTLSAGSLADRLGRRRVFAIGLVVFTAASLACALAPTATALNVARAFQGVGGAVMFAVSLALIAQEFHGKELGQATGVYGATIGGAVAIGPLVGGALTDSLGWESIFYLNVPIGIVATILTFQRVAESRDPDARGIDWPGLVTFSGALLMLILALLRGNAEGWGSAKIVALLAGAAVLLVAFVAVELRRQDPMLPLGLFRIPSFTGVQLGAFAISGSQFALFLYITLYLQNILGLSPLDAGVRYLPITLSSFFVAAAAGNLLARVPARVLLAVGLAMSGLGLIWMSGVGEGDEWTTLLGGFFVGGAGIGLINPAMAQVAVSVVPRAQSGMAAGINNTFRQVGIAVGIAAYGAIFLARAEGEIRDLAAGTPAAAGERPHQIAEAVSSGGLGQVLQRVPEQARGTVAHAAREGFFAGFNEILVIGGVVAIAGGVAALLLVREQDMRSDPVPAAAAA